MTNNQNTTEVWKAIPGWEGLYEASTHGRVRSLDRKIMRSNGRPLTRRGQIIAGAPHKSTGYIYLVLHAGQKKKTAKVHRLVLETFVGACPAGMEACHNNGNPADNRLENLRWDTRQNNALDRVKHGRDKERRKTHCPRGHVLRAPNLATCPSFGHRRNCLACKRTHKYTHDHPELKPHFKEIADQYYRAIMAAN